MNAADGGIDLDSLHLNLLREPPPLPLMPKRGDFDLNPGSKPRQSPGLKPAAVLVPVVQRLEPTVLFTRRTPHLAQHAGQVSFPGGRVEDGDLSLVETALRETAEETGITADFVTVAGFLEPYETGTGFAILPVVGLLAEGFGLLPNPLEVDEIFEVPLAFLRDPANRERQETDWRGARRSYYVFRHGGHQIWGATAGILVDFIDRIAR